jgi:hypothetical protein
MSSEFSWPTVIFAIACAFLPVVNVAHRLARADAALLARRAVL